MGKSLNVSKEWIAQVYLNANGFKDTYNSLLNNVICNCCISTSSNFLPPIVINGILAVELYLKFLVAMDKLERDNQNATIEKIHKIDCLFCDLSCESQIEILNLLKKENVLEREFYCFLTKNSDAFVEWRYPSNNDFYMDVIILTKLLDVLNSICYKRMAQSTSFENADFKNEYKIVVPDDFLKYLQERME